MVCTVQLVLLRLPTNRRGQNVECCGDANDGEENKTILPCWCKKTRSKVNRIKGQFFMTVTALGHINAYLCPLSSDLKNIHLLTKRLKKDQ